MSRYTLDIYKGTFLVKVSSEEFPLIYKQFINYPRIQWLIGLKFEQTFL